MTATEDRKKLCVFTIHPAKNVRILNRQCRSLQKDGWDITLIAMSEEGSYDDDGIKVIGQKRWKSRWQRLKALFSMTYRAYKQKADVYTFHDPDFLLPAIFLRLFTFRPVVYDIHEYYRIKWQLKSNNPLVKLLIRFVVGLCEDISTVMLHHVSCVYDDTAEHFQRLRCNIVRTPNYASLTDFAGPVVSEEEWTDRNNTVVHIGTLAETRGSLLLLDIARETKLRRPEIEFVVTRRFLASVEEDRMMSKLNQPAYKDVIRFVPHVSGDRLSSVLQQGVIGLSSLQDCGQYRQAFPAKFFEYMSQTLAIVASDLPWSRVFVADVGCGVVVPAAEAKAYADAIVELCDNPSETRQMGERGRHAFMERFNWQACEPDFFDFYNSLRRK